MGPHMLEWTISNSFVAWRPLHLENFLQLCFPSKQLMHKETFKIEDII